MKIYRQRQKAERDGFVNGCDIKKHVPSEEKIKVCCFFNTFLMHLKKSEISWMY